MSPGNLHTSGILVLLQRREERVGREGRNAWIEKGEIHGLAIEYSGDHDEPHKCT